MDDDSQENQSVWGKIKAAMSNQGSQKTYAEKLEEYKNKKKKKKDMDAATQAAFKSNKYPDDADEE